MITNRTVVAVRRAEPPLHAFYALSVCPGAVAVRRAEPSLHVFPVSCCYSLQIAPTSGHKGPSLFSASCLACFIARHSSACRACVPMWVRSGAPDLAVLAVRDALSSSIRLTQPALYS